MNSEEREVISRFVERVGGGQAGFTSSGQPRALPPIDPEADQYIAQEFQKYPEARYRVTQLAVVQEAALTQAQNRIRNLEFQLQQANAQIAQIQQNRGAGSGQSGGFFSNLFGRGPSAGGPPPGGQPGTPPSGWNMGGRPTPSPSFGQGQAPGYAPGYAPASMGAFPRSGTGFLGSALTTAAGVAGGMMAANALEGLFSHHDGGGHAGLHDAASGGDTMTGNDYGDAANAGATASDPFGGGGTADQGFSQSDFPEHDFSNTGDQGNLDHMNVDENSPWDGSDNSGNMFDDGDMSSGGDDSFF